MTSSDYIQDIKSHLPDHLHRFIQDYDYQAYTSEDHALWRYIVRQLKFGLLNTAHHDYLKGLEAAGIELDHIPKIKDIDAKLQDLGWRAIPVSGFIPPAAFMEFQANKALPIATAIRSIEHTHYTPAPDIVHEAAGHAPMLVNKEFSDYLETYATMATKAIYSKSDIDVYKAIRNLSDEKENPHASAEEIKKLEKILKEKQSKSGIPSEAAQIAKMNWWTAEYGLFGSIDNPKIIGAGLLSSIGESRSCLNEKVKKIPLSLNCLDYNYDITNPQPQLFVAESFKQLKDVLLEHEKTMAFKVGGTDAANKALNSKTVNTFILETGLQISGLLEDGLSSSGAPSFVRFSGPCQISVDNKQLNGHSKEYHPHGYSSPLGFLENGENLTKLNKVELSDLGIKKDTATVLKFKSGYKVEGTVTELLFIKDSLSLITFKDCTALNEQDQVIFEPAWGNFDMATSCEISGVFGGPADPTAYDFNNEFELITVPTKTKDNPIFDIYSQIRAIRDKDSIATFNTSFIQLFNNCKKSPNKLWLPLVELLELSYYFEEQPKIKELESYLINEVLKNNKNLTILITDGIKLANKFNINNKLH